ncbi:hypothetical protein J4Q44_G00164360 [Coregonus suidteri]|uniref:Uncharacterized protein n=1 Tax=Coregonus suidteri TaxID=861788 RepID=A0AAN8LNQ6_9TELE
MQSFAFREHDERDSSAYKGNYKELAEPSPLLFPDGFETLRVSKMYGIRAELHGNESAGGWAPEGQCLQQHDPREGAGGGGLTTIHHCQCPGTD